MSYRPMTKEERAIWKKMFQAGDSFKKIGEFFRDRRTWDFSDMFGSGGFGEASGGRKKTGKPGAK